MCPSFIPLCSSQIIPKAVLVKVTPSIKYVPLENVNTCTCTRKHSQLTCTPTRHRQDEGCLKGSRPTSHARKALAWLEAEDRVVSLGSEAASAEAALQHPKQTALQSPPGALPS